MNALTTLWTRVAAVMMAIGGITMSAAYAGAQPPQSPQPAKADPKDKNDADKKAEADKVLNSQATKIAILNFGPPSSWGSDVESTVGVEICAEDWKRAVPLLEKDGVQVVVVRINSGGGALSEMEPFQNLFQNVYKPKFRTVAWVESAISCAAMSPYPIEEFYFLPNGNLGACTAWHGDLKNVEGMDLEQIKVQMEKASRWGKRDPVIMKAMQVQVPLSATIDKETGEVKWFQDTTGETLLNPPTQIFTFTANDAVKYKFAQGIAANKEELAKVMGIHEPVWAGQEASRYIDDQLRKADKAQKRWQTVYSQYAIQIEHAQAARDKKERASFVGSARRYLDELRNMFKINHNFGMSTGITKGWFNDQDLLLKNLLR